MASLPRILLLACLSLNIYIFFPMLSKPDKSVYTGPILSQTLSPNCLYVADDVRYTLYGFF